MTSECGAGREAPLKTPSKKQTQRARTTNKHGTERSMIPNASTVSWIATNQERHDATR